MSAPVTRNLTILLTDIKGFTDKTAHQSRVQIQEMLDRHKGIVLPVLEGRGGRLVKTIGDAFLMVFESPTDAVLAGMAVQDALLKDNEGRPPAERLEVRIAINQGEVNLADNDIFGEPVNITARIEAMAEAGEVYFTEAVYLAMNKTEVPSSEVGLLQLKGIPEKVRVYKVRREHPVEGLAEAPALSRRRFWGLFRAPAAPAAGAAMSPGAAALDPAPLWRRAVAVAVDWFVCLVLISTLVPGDVQHVNFRRRREAASPAGARAGGGAGRMNVTREEWGLRRKLVQQKGRQSRWARTSRRIVVLKTGRPDTGGAAAEARQWAMAAVAAVAAKEGAARAGAAPAELEAAKREAEDDAREEAEEAAAEEAEQAAEEAGEEKVFEGEKWRVGVREVSKRVAFPIAWLLLGTLFVWALEATPGKKALGLKVVTATGARVDARLAFVRALCSVFSGSFCLLGYLWAFWDRDRRTWHDVIAETRVVSA